MLRGAAARAKRAGVDFAISEEDIVIPLRCPVFHLTLRHGRDNLDTSPTLDRIVPSRGYVRGNIVVISGRANRIKNDATLEELEALVAFYSTLIAPAKGRRKATA